MLDQSKAPPENERPEDTEARLLREAQEEEAAAKAIGARLCGATAVRGSSAEDYQRVCAWVYGAVRQSAGRCVTLDAAGHLHDRNWLLPPPLPPLGSKTAAATRGRGGGGGGSNTATDKRSRRVQSPKGGSTRGGGTPSATIAMPGQANGRPGTAGTTQTGVTQNTAARAEARQRRRNRVRNDPAAKPWRQEPAISGGAGGLGHGAGA